MNATSLHREIEQVSVKAPEMLENMSSRYLQRQLKGKQFISTYRHGKYLFTGLDSGLWLVLHFGMTGFLKYFKRQTESPEHIRLLIQFTNGYSLAYDCQRKLGVIGLTDNLEKYMEHKKLGSDPYESDFDLNRFKTLLKGKRGSIKSALMNQKVIAGIGNIYSDEILFHAGIHPASQVKKLDEAELEHVYQCMRTVLQTGIDSKVDPEQFPRHYLLPHRNQNGKCPLCGGELKHTPIAGRTSHFCNKHQKAKN